MSATRVAFVTGGAQGIGEAIALGLAADGLDVAILDVKGKEELMQSVVEKIAKTGRRALWLVGDVTSEQSIKDSIAKTVGELGSLDVMVANAGILQVGAVTELSVEDWNRVFAVNTTGVMLCYKHAAIQMIKQGRGGRIIGACSVAGKHGFAHAGAYSASKFAVRGLTHSMSQEMKAHNITVNAYAPGFIDTPMITAVDEKMGKEAPSGAKTASPSVVADLVSYLAKPESHFINGQIITIDGGEVLD
ncbi:NAD-binding protein [Irpex rosettiformis]|uniref:NAD-binding protein n=1 Tax=Irpex rosettiformis TaxID=378272 RepID=A0ACB8TPI7_9APHY|nr:NAD-binding protein [Irpex rosettiformis]